MKDSSLIKTLPNFSQINPKTIEAELKLKLAANRATLHKLLQQPHFTWENLFLPLEEMHDALSKFWSPISHLHAVSESDELRTAYNACTPLLAEYHTEIMQNTLLYKAALSIANHPSYSALNPAARKVIDNELRDFKLAGVHLSSSEKAQFGELQKKLSQLSTQFAENLLDATHAWTLHITDRDSLIGLPESALKLAEHNAQERNLSGWVLTLDHPCYSAVMKYLAHRELRWLVYEAYVTRASNQGPHAGQWDNTPLMEDILKTRHSLATLAGFKNYAEYSLATKMAANPSTVLKFLHDLVERSKPTAAKEFQALAEFAKQDGIEQLEAWDIAYYTEKYREEKFAFSQEDLRPFFPQDKVMQGMFALVQQLFGITIVERLGVESWHPSVQFFEIFDENKNCRGAFYTDLYARPHKREGAWMDEYRSRRFLSNTHLQIPIAFLTCNFSRPLDSKSALLTHEDVQTLFHEFGHCLHHLLTVVDYSPVSGINGVPWDAVEFPSQFLELWCFEKEVLSAISAHEKTGEPLPDRLYNKLIAAKNFHSGLQMLRQLEFALFDFRLHLEIDLTKKSYFIQSILDDVRQEISVFKIPAFNRFQNSFAHIFSGGYAAGYYSYKWAEVLSTDAFSLFEEEGVLNPKIGRKFLHCILEQGGVKDPMDLYISFRGREPSIDALLKISGL